MKVAFRHLGWFFKENWFKYILGGIALLIVSVFPVIPAKILGLAIDEIAMGTLTNIKFAYYIIGLMIFPITI